MKKTILAAAAAAMTALPAIAAPVSFSGEYGLTVYDGDVGLEIESIDPAAAPDTLDGTAAGAGTFAFTLDRSVNDGFGMRYNLFDIYTDETTLNLDDFVPREIAIDFDFVQPQPGFGDVATGVTRGVLGIGTTGSGQLNWDNNGYFDFSFGANGDGLLRLHLTGGSFNRGSACSLRIGSFCFIPNPTDLNPGTGTGVTRVTAQFQLIREATEVPEPGAIALFGLGALALAAVRRRRA